MANETQNPEDLVESLLGRIQYLEDAINALGYANKSSKKRRFPSKRQSAVMYGLTRALCVETVDPWKENRVRFYHPILHDPNTPILRLPFAAPVSSMGGFDDCGLNWVPPAGSTLVIFFEGGAKDVPFYIGTTWHRDRGPGGRKLLEVFPSREYQSVYQGHRGGHLVGPDDESQSLPPWVNESYNAGHIDDITQFTDDPLEQKRMTYPNIYGFKTPEKHMLKMVDGNAKCNRRWKRMEMQSGGGNWLIFKDDHLHYGGQWAHPDCPPDPGGESVDSCSTHQGQLPFFTDFHGQPVEGLSQCNGKVQTSGILGGHTSTPGNPPDQPTNYHKNQGGANKFFNHRNECRPYKGPGTPQNNRCQLPQSGIQWLSISGHTFGMDDSVEEPRGKPEWERSTETFDFGCNDKYLGVMWLKSATGHGLTFSDVESDSNLRGENNYVELKSANGNFIKLNDHTIGQKDCPGCPPNLAGPERGVHIGSTSTHRIKLIDHLNEQCSPCRKEGGVPVPKATRAYVEIASGYGSSLRFSDDFSQQQTMQQWVQLTNPQCVDPNTDPNCNSCGSPDCRGPHFLRFQGRPKGQAGVVFLRAGGHAIRQTYDNDVVLVGDKERNPSDKFTYVSRKHIRISEGVDYRYSGDQHILMAENRILLMAGRDCPGSSGCKGPCLYNVIVARCPVTCPLTGIIHWTEKSASERVFASGYHPCQVPCDGGDCSDYSSSMAAAGDPPCGSQNDFSIDTGAGTIGGDTDVQQGTQIPF